MRIAVNAKVNVPKGEFSSSRPQQGTVPVARHHIALVRTHVPEILRVIAGAEKARLHYIDIQHRVNQEEGKHVSGIHTLLAALVKGGVLRKLPRGGGYELSPSGRAFHSALETIQAIEGHFEGDGDAGVR